MAQIKPNAQTNSATDPGLSGLFKSSVTSIYIVLFLSQTVTCSLWGYIDSVSFSHCTGTTIVLHLNSLISFWYHDVTSTEVFWGCLENSELVPWQGYQLTHGCAAQQAQLPFPSPAFSLDWSQNGFLYPLSRVPPPTGRKCMCMENMVPGKGDCFGQAAVARTGDRQGGFSCHCCSMAGASGEFVSGLD